MSTRFPIDEITQAVLQRLPALTRSVLKGDKGDPGAASTVPGPKGPAGRDMSEDDVRRVVHEVLHSDVERFRGVPGKDGASVVGEQGKPGRPATYDEVKRAVYEILSTDQKIQERFRGEVGPSGKDGRDGTPAPTRSDIAALVVSILGDVGVLSANAKKLIAVKACIQQWTAEADIRYLGQIQRMVKQVSNIVGDVEVPPTSLHEEVAAAALKKLGEN